MNKPTAKLALVLAASALIGSTLPAALDLDKVGVNLGGTLKLTLKGDPMEAYLLLPSLNTGPTQLSLFDPGDPRQLAVGLETLYLARTGVLNGSGTATAGFPLPADPALQGLRLNWQAFTAPGTTRIVDDISNRVVTQLGRQNSFTRLPQGLPFSTALPGAAPLGDGRILVCGGYQGNLTSGTALASAATFDPWRHAWTKAASMTAVRGLFVTIPLDDGRVLVSGGVDTAGKVTAGCEIFDPKTNRWSATGSMKVPRGGHAGVKLADGRVLVSGGVADLSDPIKAITGAHKSTEIYDPKTGTWSYSGNMRAVRIYHTLTRLGNRVLATGGLSYKIVIFVPVPEFTNTAELWSGSGWTSAGSFGGARVAHSAIALADGRVLICGGFYGTNIIDPNSYKAIDTASLYDPVARTWTTMGRLRTARGLASLILLPDKRVLVVGGAQGSYTNPVGLATCEVFSPNTFAWHTFSQTTNRVGAGVVALPDGSVLFAGGAGGTTNTSLGSCELLHR